MDLGLDAYSKHIPNGRYHRGDMHQAYVYVLYKMLLRKTKRPKKVLMSDNSWYYEYPRRLLR